MSDYDHLPEFYVADDGSRVSEPVYRILNDCFFGRSGAAARWEAGSEIATDLTPNHEMLPLNRAAGQRMQAWLDSLPGEGVTLTPEEISESAKLMAPKLGEPQLEHELWWAGVIELAQRLKAKRRGRTFIMPDTHVRPANAPPAPPMSAGRFEDANPRDVAKASGVIPQAMLPGKRVTRRADPMSTSPAQPMADAAPR
jgi:hypothetical protein